MKKKPEPFIRMPRKLASGKKDNVGWYGHLKKTYTPKEMFTNPNFFEKLFKGKRVHLKTKINGRKIKHWLVVAVGDFPEDWEYIPIFYNKG